jgi:hypothetical protein
VFEIVLYRLRHELSLRNLAEMFLLCGFQFTHEAVREWEAHFAPLLAEQLRRKGKGKAGRRWVRGRNLRKNERQVVLLGLKPRYVCAINTSPVTSDLPVRLPKEQWLADHA